VGRAAFKKGSIPRAVAMPSHSPHALRSSSFRAPGWGAPVLLSSCCCWRSATSRRSAPFSHRLASRIFIRQPGCIPSPMVTQDGDHWFDGGEKQAGLRPLPRPQLQGSSSSLLWRGRAEPEFYLPHGLAGHLFLQHSGERALTSLAEGRTLTMRGRPAASVVSSSVPGLLAQLALALLPVPPPTAGAERGRPLTLGAAVAPCVPGDHPRHRTPLGQRSCYWIVLSSLRHDASMRRSVPARSRGLEWGSAGAGWGATRGQTSISLALTACPRPSCGDVGEGLPTSAFALRSSLLLFSRLRRRSLSLLLQRSPASHPKFVVPQALRCGGCSYPREWNRSSVYNGTLSAGVCSLRLSGPEHLCIWA
jgi:hypothetical protein